ncbi:MAG: hypothetical protein JSS00_09495 [Proteobacteria bacterium]|nr:hypothetical protein [Pseudomonadota bacterium]
MKKQFQTIDWSKAKRSFRRTAIYLGIYLILTFASASMLVTLHPSRALAITLALVPAFAAIGIVRAYLLSVRELDEFQRRLHYEAILIAAAVTAFASVAYGFLELWAGFPRLPAFFAMLVMVGAFSLAIVVLNWRHRL